MSGRCGRFQRQDVGDAACRAVVLPDQSSLLSASKATTCRPCFSLPWPHQLATSTPPSAVGENPENHCRRAWACALRRRSAVLPFVAVDDGNRAGLTSRGPRGAVGHPHGPVPLARQLCGPRDLAGLVDFNDAQWVGGCEEQCADSGDARKTKVLAAGHVLPSDLFSFAIHPDEACAAQRSCPAASYRRDSGAPCSRP